MSLMSLEKSSHCCIQSEGMKSVTVQQLHSVGWSCFDIVEVGDGAQGR